MTAPEEVMTGSEVSEPVVTEVITVNEADLTDLKELLEKQVEILEEEKLKKEELEQQQQEESLLLGEEQQATNEIYFNMLEAQNISMEETNEHLLVLIEKLDNVIEQQNEIKVISVEAAWLLAISIAIATSLKIFWNQMLKW